MQKTKDGSGSKTRPNRVEYLDQLVVEFQTTKSKDAREQVLANLANFAFDPLNYEFFRRLNILDLFLDNLSSEDENLVKFSIGGLCNLCLDPINKQYIIRNGLKGIISLLGHVNEEVLLSAMTTLMFLITPESKQGLSYKKQGIGFSSADEELLSEQTSIDQQEMTCNHGAALLEVLVNLKFHVSEITSSEVVSALFNYSKDKNRRLSNLAKIFLEDYCTEEQIKKASVEFESAKIPLPESQPSRVE